MPGGESGIFLWQACLTTSAIEDETGRFVFTEPCQPWPWNFKSLQEDDGAVREKNKYLGEVRGRRRSVGAVHMEGCSAGACEVSSGRLVQVLERGRKLEAAALNAVLSGLLGSNKQP